MNEGYKLYALRSTTENLEALVDERFTRATREYLLLYTTQEKPDNAVEVGLEHLSIADIQWLQACNEVLVMEQMWQHQQDIAAAMGERIEELEIELKKQKESLNNVRENSVESNN